MSCLQFLFKTAGVVVLGWGAVAAVPATAQSNQAFVEVGEREYMANCAACHGAEGKGNGPVAEVLSPTPSDLTRISERHDGEFPRDYLIEVIDGREMMSAHGELEMPVWGRRFMARAVEQSAAVTWDVDAQAIVLGRMTALVDYLASIQAE